MKKLFYGLKASAPCKNGAYTAFIRIFLNLNLVEAAGIGFSSLLHTN